MKVLIAFGFFLIAGILNSGVTQAEEPKKPPAKQTYENDGRQLRGFFQTPGIQCCQEKAEGIRACFLNSTKSFGSTESSGATTGSPSAVIPKPFDPPKIARNEKNCRALKDLQNCVVGHLNECTQKTPAKVANSIFNTIMRVSGCTELPNPPEAQTTNAP